MAAADPFKHAVNTANIWLADISDALGTTDRHLAHRTLRAWLHCLRDRLTVESAVKFGAQLPELIRGTFYEGWIPSRVPIRYERQGYLQRFATDAGIRTAQAPSVLAAITGVLAAHMSPGQVEQALAALPADLRATLTAAAAPAPATVQTSKATESDRLDKLEDQIGSLTEAVRTLAHSLEDAQLTGIEAADVSRAARLADEILIGSSRNP